MIRAAVVVVDWRTTEVKFMVAKIQSTVTVDYSSTGGGEKGEWSLKKNESDSLVHSLTRSSRVGRVSDCSNVCTIYNLHFALINIKRR